jgi:hypothetical protein
VERFRLVRVLRTLSSEIYLVWRDEQRIGQIDIHYTASSVQADVCLESPLDEDVVSSHLPSFDREQFIITIFVGREIDSFNYPPDSDEIGEN